MRKIEFNEINLKNKCDEETFYKLYLQGLKKKDNDNNFVEPSKNHEIFYLNIFDGKIILLNTNYIKSDNSDNKELYYNYDIALKIYNLILDINDGIQAEKNEINELYKKERLEKEQKIEELKKLDEDLFKKKVEEYNIIINSPIYKENAIIKAENEKLKLENQKLTEILNSQKNNIGFFKKLINRLKNKRLPIK